MIKGPSKIGNKADQAILLRAMVETSPNGMLVTDGQQNIITYNRRCVEMWGVAEHLLANNNLSEVLEYVLPLVKNAASLKQKIERVKEDPDFEDSSIIELNDGRFFERHGMPCKIRDGLMGRITHFVDITEYKKAEQKVSEYANLLQSVNTNVNEAILRSTPKEGLVYVNDAFVKMFGYGSKEEVLATDPSDFYVDQEKRWQFVQKLKKEGFFINQEVRYKRKDGSWFWGLENSTLTNDRGHTFIDAVVTDVDNWKEAEKALRKSEKKYRSILNNMEEGYFETNLRGDLTFFNAKFVDILKYDAEDMLGMNYSEYLDEENAQRAHQKFNEIYESGTSDRNFNTKLQRGDGKHIIIGSSITSRKNAAGKTVGFSGLIRDITERKKKQQQIQQSLREKEVLLGEIHHRVKNNLAIISGLLYLQADKTTDKKARRALTESQQRVSSMALIHELLYNNNTFSSLNPRAYIEQLVDHIASNLNTGNVNVKTIIEADHFNLAMDTAIPCALIINELLTNAFKYAFKNGEQGTIKIVFQKQQAGYCLMVADNGRGLPAHFDLSNNDNHSLGLSLVKTLTRQLKGHIEIDTHEGTSFVIYIPLENF